VITDWTLVTAVVDRIVPEDEYPSASQAGIVDQLAADASSHLSTLWATSLAPGLERLQRRALDYSGMAFADLDEPTQDELLEELANDIDTGSAEVGKSWYATLVRLVCEHYYGTRGAASWKMLGYSPGLRRSSGLTNPPEDALATITLAEVRETYDILVVGLGFTGATAARALAEAGHRVHAVDRRHHVGGNAFDRIDHQHQDGELALHHLGQPRGRHVAQRIQRFMDKGSGDSFNIDLALESFARGGWFGRGPGEGTVKRLLPESHTDFVFAVAAEEFGVALCLVLVALYAFIVIRALARAMRSEDAFTRFAAAGLAILFGMQSAINVAVNLDLIPTKGMTLPFISYGGSSMLAMGPGAEVLPGPQSMKASSSSSPGSASVSSQR